MNISEVIVPHAFFVLLLRPIVCLYQSQCIQVSNDTKEPKSRF